MNNPIKVLVPLLAGFVACVLLTSCAGGGSSGNSLTGRVIDAASGQSVAGATILFAGYSATTAADGTFGMSFSSLSGTERGTFQAGKTGYSGIYWEGLACDRSRNTAITVPLNPLSTAGYTMQTVSGTILDSTAHEIAGNPTVIIQVLSKTGARYTASITYNSGYSITTPAFGPDCLLAATVAGSFTVIENSIDLMGGPKTVHLMQDAIHTTSVSVTPSASGTSGEFWFQSPYGMVNVWQYNFPSSSSTIADITNPYGYQGFWVQQAQAADTPATGFTKTWRTVSTTGPVASSVSLPSLGTSLGPSAGSDSASFAYSGGILSAQAATGANAYQFLLREDVPSPACAVLLVSSGPTVTLPSWMQDQFSGKNIQVNLWAVDSSSSFVNDMSVEDLAGMGPNGLVPDSQYAAVTSASATLPF